MSYCNQTPSLSARVRSGHETNPHNVIFLGLPASFLFCLDPNLMKYFIIAQPRARVKAKLGFVCLCGYCSTPIFQLT